MMNMPRLKGLWEGEWPYRPGDGVGMRFEGFPSDVEQFRYILAGEGCHPNAAERILSRITQHGYDLLTVMSRLNFDWIHRELAKIDVKMTIIPPQVGWEEKYQDGPWPTDILKKAMAHAELIKQRLD
jgi:hypothetical protein